MTLEGSEEPELSLVFPAYNEAKRIASSLERAFEYLGSAYRTFELIVVDDGSSDDTLRVAQEALEGRTNARVLSLPENRGKGAAVRTGMLAARGDRILFSDTDLSSPIEEEAKLADALARGADVAIGTRAHPESNVAVAQGKLRQSMGRTFNVLLRLLGLTPFSDTQCGFKMFTREAAHSIFPVTRVHGFAFDVEILYLADRAGFRVVEVPVEWRNDPASRVNMVTDSARMILEALRIRWLYPPWGSRSGISRAVSDSSSSNATERSRPDSGGPA
jgi:dolichyl-phosphate beta-glucosyltransferase